jgi:hypothetical protein
MPPRNKHHAFASVLDAASQTAELLAEAGLEFTPAEDDLELARGAASLAARDPSLLQSAYPMQSLTQQTPAALLLTRSILQEFGHKVVQEAETVRHLVMNKLVVETENPDPRVRIRALELLGKMGDVGLFTEKKEVVVTHQTSDDVKSRLKAKLSQMLSAVPDAEVLPPHPELEAGDDGGDEDDEDDGEEFDAYELNLECRPASRSLFDE